MVVWLCFDIIVYLQWGQKANYLLMIAGMWAKKWSSLAEYLVGKKLNEDLITLTEVYCSMNYKNLMFF